MPASPVLRPERLVSVDIEAAGPNPSRYSMLAIGACLVDEPERGFYVELKPVHDEAVESSLAVGKLSLEELAVTGTEPGAAMQQFAEWIGAEVPDGHVPVFVGFNAPFDWMFVDDYFHRFLGDNPFGHSALDIKSFYMGKSGSSWGETSLRHLSPRYLGGRPLTHNALGDARDQAELFRLIRDDDEFS
jgi:DNA polymerase III epsilon subunit-like protein